MAVINLAWSGGVESVAMYHKAMKAGHTVNPCLVNATGSACVTLVELIALAKVEDYFRDHMDDYPGSIGKTFVMMDTSMAVPSIYTIDSNRQSPFVHIANQSLNVVLGMMQASRSNIHLFPSTWIGFIQEDTSEHTLNINEWSEADYQVLLNLPATLGKLAGTDIGCRPFIAPLWDVPKRILYNDLPGELKELVLPNLISHWYTLKENDEVVLTVSKEKEVEWERAGIPLPTQRFVFRLKDSTPAMRLLVGLPTPKDLEIEDDLGGTLHEIAQGIIRRKSGYWMNDYEEVKGVYLDVIKDILRSRE